MTGVTGTIAGTAGVSNDTSRLGTRENLEAAGQRFEAIFVGMMLHSMRTAKLADGLFENQAQGQFRDMQDQQLAQTMAANAPIGIGRAMVEFLERAGVEEGTSPAPAPDGETP